MKDKSKNKKSKSDTQSTKKLKGIEENFNLEIAKEIYSTPLDKKAKSKGK